MHSCLPFLVTVTTAVITSFATAVCPHTMDAPLDASRVEQASASATLFPSQTRNPVKREISQPTLGIEWHSNIILGGIM